MVLTEPVVTVTPFLVRACCCCVIYDLFASVFALDYMVQYGYVLEDRVPVQNECMIMAKPRENKKIIVYEYKIIFSLAWLAG